MSTSKVCLLAKICSHWIKTLPDEFLSHILEDFIIEMSYLAINKRTLKTYCLQNIKIKVLHLEHYY